MPGYFWQHATSVVIHTVCAVYNAIIIQCKLHNYTYTSFIYTAYTVQVSTYIHICTYATKINPLLCIPVCNLWLVACSDLCTCFVEACGGVIDEVTVCVCIVIPNANSYWNWKMNVD